MHADQIERYGGAPGVRDQGLLEAALYRPQTGDYAGLIEQAGSAESRFAETLRLFHEYSVKPTSQALTTIGCLSYKEPQSLKCTDSALPA